MLAVLVFGVATGCLVALCAGMVVTLVSEARRFWPPDGDTTKRRLYLGLTQAFLGCLLATGLLDWNSGSLAWPGRLAPGLVVFVAGIVLLAKSAADLGEEATNGRVGELQTEGLYRYTRNPQNVAYILSFVGFALVTNSRFVAVLALGATVFLILQSLVEEPWLRETCGPAYVEYCDDVPRFTNLRSIERALEQYRK